MNLFLFQKQKATFSNGNSSQDGKLATLFSWGSNSVIYDIFTREVNFPVRRHYLGCQCDVINDKNFHEILRYLFQILAKPLKQLFIVFEILSLLSSSSPFSSGKSLHEFMEICIYSFLEISFVVKYVLGQTIEVLSFCFS